MNIFHTELNTRTHAYFSWWTPPEPLLEDRTRHADVVTPTVDVAES